MLLYAMGVQILHCRTDWCFYKFRTVSQRKWQTCLYELTLHFIRPECSLLVSKALLGLRDVLSALAILYGGHRNIVRTTDCCRRDNICWAQYIWQYICWAGGFCTILPPNILPSTDLLNLICNTSASKIFSIRCILRKSIWFVSHVRSYLCAENWLLATCSCQSRRFHILRFSAHPSPSHSTHQQTQCKAGGGLVRPPYQRFVRATFPLITQSLFERSKISGFEDVWSLRWQPDDDIEKISPLETQIGDAGMIRLLLFSCP